MRVITIKKFFLGNKIYDEISKTMEIARANFFWIDGDEDHYD
jgi:hypothetical protein